MILRLTRLKDVLRELCDSSPESNFKPIPMTDNKYEINETGTILRTRKTRQPRKYRFDGRMTAYGYYYVRIQKPGAIRTRKHKPTRDIYIHRAVADAFLGPLTPGMEVHHRDHNSLNNCVSNLQVLTPEEHFKLHGKSKVTTRRRSK